MSYSHCHKVLVLLLLDWSWHEAWAWRRWINNKFNKTKFTFFSRIKIIDIKNPNQISVDIKYTVICCYVETWYEKSQYYTITLLPTDTDGWHRIGEYINRCKNHLHWKYYFCRIPYYTTLKLFCCFSRKFSFCFPLFPSLIRSKNPFWSIKAHYNILENI